MNSMTEPPAIALPTCLVARPVTIRFVEQIDDMAWWDPDSRTISVDASLTGRDLAETLLHEIAHAIYGDDVTIAERAHDLLDRWAVQSASLLELVRLAVPA